MTNVNEHDFRANSLDKTISALYDTILEMREFHKDNSWYDGVFLLEDTEHIFGLALIAFQNYINATIKDLTTIGGKTLQQKYYAYGVKFAETDYTAIQLIISLANYIKHKEDDNSEFHYKTKFVLEAFGFNTDKNCDINDSAIFDGLALMDEYSNLKKIQTIVQDWRENIAKDIIAKSI